MPSKAEPYADITCTPAFKLPPLERLESRGDPPANLERAVKHFHDGLRKVSLEAMKVRDAKGENVGTFQRYSFVPNDAGRPSLAPKMISCLIADRAETFARERDHIVHFRVYLQWVDSGGKNQEKQVRFMVDPSRLEDDDEEDDDDVDGDEDTDDDSGDIDPEEAEDDRADDEDDQDEYDDDEYDQPTPAVRANGRSHGNNGLVRHPPRDTAAPYTDQALLGTLEPAMGVHPAVPQMQAMGMQPDLSGGVPLHINMNFVLQLMERQNAMVARIWATNARESRRDRRVMRREFTTTIRETRRIMKVSVDDSRAQRDSANHHAENLAQQIVDITTEQRADIVNYQQIAAHSWKAFRHAQEAELSMAGRILGYERALFDERLAASEERALATSGPSQWPGAITSAMPTLLGVGSTVAGFMGKTDLADKLMKLATVLAPRGDDDELGMDEEEGDVVDTEAREADPGSPEDEPAAQPEPERASPPAPTRDGARALLETIDQSQAIQLRAALPKGAWEAFEQTAHARTESAARLMVGRLDELVRTNSAAQQAVLSALRPEQAQSLLALVRVSQRRRVPPRPRATAATG